MVKTKILISTRYSIFDLEGTSIRAKRIINVLKDHFNVYLITSADNYDNTNTLNKENIFVIKPKKTRLWPLKIIPIILNNKFDIVICESDWLGFPVYWILSKIKKYKLVFEAHGILSEEAKDWGTNIIIVKMFKIIEKICIKNSNLVFVLSEEIGKKYKKMNDNIVLVPVFLENMNYDLKNTGKKQDTSERKIGIIGPFGTARNEYYAPEFINNNLSKFDEHIRFVIIGKCGKKIRNQRISYLGYIKSFEEYLKIINNLDAILVIEKKKTSGPLNKILEPMSLGKPVFTTPNGVFGLDHAKNNFNIFINTETELIKNLNKMIYDSKKLESISANAKKTTKKYYSERSNKKRIICSLNRLFE